MVSKKTLKGFFVGVIFSSIVIGSTAIADPIEKTILATFSGIKTYLDGNEITSQNELFTYNGTVYMPLDMVQQITSKTINYDENSSVISIKDANTSTNTSNNSSSTETTYKIGDTINLGDCELTIDKVSLTKERNRYHKEQFSKVVVIEYTYKNINSDEDIFISDNKFKVYDEEGNALSTYPTVVDKYPTRISTGKKCTAQMSYGFNNGSKLELDFYRNMFIGKAEAKIIIDAK